MGIKKWIAAGVGVAAIGAAAGYAQYRDIEVPAYQVVKAEAPFELRDYKPMIVAEVTHTGDQSRTRGEGFRRLAAYIFGQDRPAGGEDIAMTAPVMQDRAVDQDEAIAMTAPVMRDSPEADQWRTRFVMPSKYTLETLPAAPADITLTEVPGRRIAAVRFSGTARAGDLADMEAELSKWVASEGLKPIGGFEHAFYDAPMVPGPLRRNEVMVEVAAE